jgi:signal transduction histidine kinase
MQTASKRQPKSEIDDLQAALEAETELRLQAEDSLRRSREDFEAFMLSAVHDLREPLRTVSAYSELLGRKDAEHSDAEVEQFRHYVLDGTARMQALITGMMEYATAASDNGHLLSVDMNCVFEEASAASPSATAARSASPHPGLPAAAITREPLPVVRANFGKLVKVARHLLDNAARYCEQPEPRIHVACRKQDTDWLFTVEDNGPGIEAAYQQRIFEPFKRLHGRQQPGSGLGLAYCRGAIESHGGRIWVESKPGQGSTFAFTLPRAD